MKRFAIFMAITAFICANAQAQDISGTWQGTTKGQQVVLKVTGTTKTGFRGRWFHLGPERAGSALTGNTTSSIRVEGNAVGFVIDQTLDNFSGTLSQDGKSIAGNWTGGWGPLAPQPLTLQRASAKTAWVIDPSPHKTRFVTVDKGVRLEVLDWGGSGPPLIFLSGAGCTAHEFDQLAPQFINRHHVYAITRRGFGASSIPAPTAENYDSDRLADDVLSVMDTLHIEKPVLAGHSVAGEELSSIGTRHPEKVAGLVYLEAYYARSFYAPDADTGDVDIAMMRRALNHYPPMDGSASHARQMLDEMLTLLPRLEKSLKQQRNDLEGQKDWPPIPPSPQQLATGAIFAAERKYTGVTVPVLAISAVPPACKPNCDSAPAKAAAAVMSAQADAFEAGNAHARMVRIPYASHFIFRSNEVDVLREMNTFMDGLPH